MDLSEIEAEIAHLLNKLERAQPQDRHQIHLELREQIRQMRSFGMPVPEDLKRLQAQLEAEFAEDAAEASEQAPPAPERS